MTQVGAAQTEFGNEGPGQTATDRSSYSGADAQSFYQGYWADTSRSWTPRDQPIHVTEEELLKKYIRPGSSVLDIGCGDGRMGMVVQKLGASYKGLDLSESAVDLCRNRGLEAQIHNLENPLPFPDKSFDCVIIFEVLEHLFRPDYAVIDIVRCLRPGGRIIGSVPNVASLSNRGMLAFGVFNPGGSPETSLHAPWKDPHLRFFTSQTLKLLVSGAAACSVAELIGEPWSLSRLPVIYKSPKPLLMLLNAISWPVKWIGRTIPQMFSNRLFFVAITK